MMEDFVMALFLLAFLMLFPLSELLMDVLTLCYDKVYIMVKGEPHARPQKAGKSAAPRAGTLAEEYDDYDVA